MSRAWVFAKRNMTETARSPISWIFGLALPVGIFAIMQIIVKSIGDAASEVPMFGVDRFTGGVLLFGASFLSVLCAILISNDRSQSFLSRLFASPMRSSDYIIGYTLSALPIAAAQNVITFIAALCFGLTPTANILLAVLFSLLFSVLFIAIGVLFGSILSAKGAPPVCSAVVQVAALLSGMWFDLDMIGGGFSVFCHVLPFAHSYDLIRYTLSGDFGKLWLPLLVVVAYTAAFSVAAVLTFRHKSKSV
ncbi:MAG: ABC transporter permease [Roseburia sp.]|nr:ABC transporter permease [Roseburia sp.]